MLNFFKSIYGNNKSFSEVITIYRQYLVKLNVVLVDMTYRLQK